MTTRPYFEAAARQMPQARYVLPDWKHGEGGYLSLDPSGFHFHALPESANPNSETES